MAHEFILEKTGHKASVEPLDLSHLAQVLALQDETRAALPEDQKMFVLPQSRDYFEDMLSRRNGSMLGVRIEGQLVSQMVVMGVITLEQAIERNAITRNDVTFHHAGGGDLSVIAKSMTVHPAWRGNDLSRHMLEAMLELPFVRTVDHVFAQISVENTRSWDIFLRHGFGIVAALIDPVDHKPRFIMQKPAGDFLLHSSVSAEDLDPVKDFTTIMRLTEREALVGQLDDINPAHLSFNASRELAASWSDETGLARGA